MEIKRDRYLKKINSFTEMFTSKHVNSSLKLRTKLHYSEINTHVSFICRRFNGSRSDSAQHSMVVLKRNGQEFAYDKTEKSSKFRT